MPWPRRHCVRWGPSSPTERGTAAPTFPAMSIVAKQSPISAAAELLLLCSIIELCMRRDASLCSHVCTWNLAGQWTGILLYCILQLKIMFFYYKRLFMSFFFSGMHHKECIAIVPYVNISLCIGTFWAMSTASGQWTLEFGNCYSPNFVTFLLWDSRKAKTALVISVFSFFVAWV